MFSTLKNHVFRRCENYISNGKKFLSHSNIATDTNKTEGNMAEIRAEKLKNENSNK